MEKICYLPLDERPCNLLMPQMMAECCDGLELAVVSQEILGHKKDPADTAAVWRYLEETACNCSCAVLSAEMLFFGGLLPSRLHHLTVQQADAMLARLRRLKERSPSLRLYMFQLIMRTPQYNSSEEEPDYYAQYGQAIFRRAYLADKQSRTGLTDEEQEELVRLEQEIPTEVRQDYEERRRFNLRLLEGVLDLTAEGIVDLLYIPQDDSCEYGYTAMDQHRIQAKLRDLGIGDRVYMHPGADEAGAEMLARAYLDLTGRTCRVHVLYGSVLGPQIIPLYEDRILGASIQQHILACGCLPCENADEADLVLAVNVPGRVMQESCAQQSPDVTYHTFRCQRLFVQQIAQLVGAGKKVAVADCAYANGGELEFISLLDKAGVLDHLLSYKGWNTACNTLGSTLAQGILALDGGRADVVRRNLVYHLMDDTFYQARVRSWLEQQIAPLGLSYFDLADQSDTAAQMAVSCLEELWQQTITHTFRSLTPPLVGISFPWKRLFEISVTLKLEDNVREINNLF